MDRSRFENYVNAFNRRDYETLYSEFFAPDVKLYTLGYLLDGSQALRNFYDFFHAYIEESLELTAFHQIEDGCFAELKMTLKAKNALTPAVLAEHGYERLPALPQGAEYETTLFIVYNVVNDRFSSIRCAEFPPVSA